MENNTSPDMVRFTDVLRVLTTNANAFKNEKDMARVMTQIIGLQKYDLKPVADNISNTTVNLIAESGKVRELIEKMKDRM